jgi:hypothetical protein
MVAKQYCRVLDEAHPSSVNVCLQKYTCLLQTREILSSSCQSSCCYGAYCARDGCCFHAPGRPEQRCSGKPCKAINIVGQAPLSHATRSCIKNMMAHAAGSQGKARRVARSLKNTQALPTASCWTWCLNRLSWSAHCQLCDRPLKVLEKCCVAADKSTVQLQYRSGAVAELPVCSAVLLPATHHICRS